MSSWPIRFLRFPGDYACSRRHDATHAACASLAVRLLALLLTATALGGCGLSSLTSGLGSGIFGGSSKTATGDTPEVSEEQLLSAAKVEPRRAASVRCLRWLTAVRRLSCGRATTT